MYLRPEELEFLDGVMQLTGIRSRGETARFLLRLLRLIIPRVDLVTRLVAEILSEETLNPGSELKSTSSKMK